MKKLFTNPFTGKTEVNELSTSPFFTPLPAKAPQVIKKTSTPPPSPKEPKAVQDGDTTIPRYHDTNHGTNHDTMIPDELIEQIRAEVYKFGKEAATHRFTVDEKKEIANIVFTFKQLGIFRVDENTVVRIALHWLLKDFKANGKLSVLHKALEALNR